MNKKEILTKLVEIQAIIAKARMNEKDIKELNDIYNIIKNIDINTNEMMINIKREQQK